ncbi:MAG: 50S ribosomal protein L11 methyltransferase [Pedobacter sp.]|nr:MAG: 50S ribosomal protein L11 methyltransferase [Pedobacter sp.]
MQYIQVTFHFAQIEDYQKDLLIDDLANIGYNTFDDTEDGFAAFIDYNSYSQEKLGEIVQQLEGVQSTYTITEIEGENWNKEWEKNFEPLVISDQCYVRATFHEPMPEYKYEIVIDPKMAFGTGHHQTTTMMMEFLLTADVKGKSVLDMGCGTGILAILAAKLGASDLVAIDNDEVCYQSTLENAALNNITNIEAMCGGKEAIPTAQFDTILANINRNILLDQIPVYAHVLKAGGEIFFSGFYESPDLDMIKEACSQVSMKYVQHKKIGDWVAAHFIKS